MADQTKMIERTELDNIAPRLRTDGIGGTRPSRSFSSSDRPAATAVVSNIAGFGEGVLSLAELQARLAVLELRQNLSAIKVGVALVIGATVVGIAGFSVALFGIAELCISAFEMGRGPALIVVGAVSFAVAGICLAMALLALRRNAARFPLSSEELTRNMQWIRTVLRHSGRASPRPYARVASALDRPVHCDDLFHHVAQHAVGQMPREVGPAYDP